MGCGLLVLALALTALGVRSFVITDIWEVDLLGDTYSLRSGQGAVVWIRQLNIGKIIRYSHNTVAHGSNSDLRRTIWGSPWEPDPSWDCHWQIGIGYLGIGSHEQDGGRNLRTLWSRAAHWQLVLPLGFASACLILWKPRKRGE